MLRKERSNRRRPVLTAATADKRRLYELAVQAPEAELEFASAWFRRLAGRPLRRLREDFCGTAYTACEWVKLDPSHSAVGVDLDGATLAWAERHNVAALTPDQRRRLRLERRDVVHPGRLGAHFDAVLAMNFSWCVFRERDRLREYFRAVRHALVGDGVFFLDIHGGYESMKELTERRRCAGFTYVWEQARYDPLTGGLTCHIHFDFKRGPMMRRAFTYHWRLWTVPELREVLTEAGFRDVTVYWEGETKTGAGSGVFLPRKHGVADASFVSYVSALA